MEDIQVLASDRYLTWQADPSCAARKQPPRKLGVSPILAVAGAAALAMGLSAYQPQPIASPLTISAKPKNSISSAERVALSSFAGAPSLAAQPGARIGAAFGPEDEDCIRAGAEVICRR